MLTLYSTDRLGTVVQHIRHGTVRCVSVCDDGQAMQGRKVNVRLCRPSPRSKHAWTDMDDALHHAHVRVVNAKVRTYVSVDRRARNAIAVSEVASEKINAGRAGRGRHTSRRSVSFSSSLSVSRSLLLDRRWICTLCSTSRPRNTCMYSYRRTYVNKIHLSM